MPRCAIYARFSTDRQSETSAEDQVRDCRRHAERQGWDVAEIYTDLAISGASNRRPGMTAMLSDAAAGSFEIVLSEALDRIARDQADIATIYQRLAFAGVSIETLTEGAVNELHIGLKGTMGALFLKDLADKIRRGQRGALSRGRIPGGRCYGYDVVREIGPDGKVQAGIRRVNEAQAEIVRRIMREYVAGRSPKAIAHDLNSEGVPSASGGEWRASAIVGNRARQIGILHNPIYVGRFVYGRVTMKRDPESRNRVSRPRPSAERESIELPELRIVDDETWQAVHDARSARAAQPLTHRKRPRHLLSGLVRCGECGGGYAIFANARLCCTRAREAGTCSNRTVVQLAVLQARVLAGLEEQLLSAEAVSLLVAEYHHERERRGREQARQSRARGRQLKEVEAAVARLVAAIADGGADFVDLRDALAVKVAERDRLAASIGEDKAEGVIALHPQIGDAYRARVKALTGALGAGGDISEEVKENLRGLIEAVYIRPGQTGVPAIEVVGSLEAALGIARGKPVRRGSAPSVLLVAEEGLEPPTRGL